MSREHKTRKCVVCLTDVEIIGAHPTNKEKRSADGVTCCSLHSKFYANVSRHMYAKGYRKVKK